VFLVVEILPFVALIVIVSYVFELPPPVIRKIEYVLPLVIIAEAVRLPATIEDSNERTIAGGEPSTMTRV
jgi:hypothetical protein